MNFDVLGLNFRSWWRLEGLPLATSLSLVIHVPFDMYYCHAVSFMELFIFQKFPLGVSALDSKICQFCKVLPPGLLLPLSVLQSFLLPLLQSVQHFYVLWMQAIKKLRKSKSCFNFLYFPLIKCVYFCLVWPLVWQNRGALVAFLPFKRFSFDGAWFLLNDECIYLTKKKRSTTHACHFEYWTLDWKEPQSNWFTSSLVNKIN